MATQPVSPETVRLEELTADSDPRLIDSARELLVEYGRFVASQTAAARFCFGSLEREAERLPVSYLELGGGCLLAFHQGLPSGFIAWRALPPSPAAAQDAWELKRLWVRPGARGAHIGRLLTEAVLARAQAARRRAIYLDTAPDCMVTAYQLYLALGFAPCAVYNGNPIEGLAYLVKFL